MMSNGSTSTNTIQNEDPTARIKSDVTVGEMAGHELNDQSIMHSHKEHQPFIKEQLQTIQKFNGLGDAEQWLKILLEKFESLQVDMDDRSMYAPALLTGEAFIWYMKNHAQMLTFISFAQLFLQHFNAEKTESEKFKTAAPMVQQNSGVMNGCQDNVFSSLRNQILLGHIEKLPKFTGRMKQNVSKWLRKINQTMHLLKLSDAEKLFFIPSCLESDARDWFFDNQYSFPTWSSFAQKLLNRFESSGKADIAFNRLRQYQQGLSQDVRYYYFEIMKLCKEANPTMDEATKIQYLKDGLRSLLRFDILLKNPKTTEQFSEYAQKIEELKSLDEQQDSNNLNMKQVSFPSSNTHTFDVQRYHSNKVVNNDTTTQNNFNSRVSYRTKNSTHYYELRPLEVKQ